MFRQLSSLAKQVTVVHSQRYTENSRFFSTKKVTVDENEVKRFTEMAKIWWNPNGKLKQLHSFNNCRVPWLTKCLTQINVTKIGKNVKELPLKGTSLLDVGCGGGFLSEALAHLGGDVTGLDATKDLIEVAQLHAKTQNLPNLRYECATIQEHAFKNNGKYDAVVCSEVIEHVSEKDQFVKYSVQCLKPGGSILITTPSKTWLSGFYTIFLSENILGVIPKGTHSYSMFVHYDDLTDMLKNEKCKIVSTNGFMNNPLSSKWFITKTKTFYYGIHALKKL